MAKYGMNNVVKFKCSFVFVIFVGRSAVWVSVICIKFQLKILRTKRFVVSKKNLKSMKIFSLEVFWL